MELMNVLLLSSVMWGCEEKWLCVRRGAWPELSHAGTLIVDFCRTVRNRSFLWPHSLCHFVIGATTKTVPWAMPASGIHVTAMLQTTVSTHLHEVSTAELGFRDSVLALMGMRLGSWLCAAVCLQLHLTHTVPQPLQVEAEGQGHALGLWSTLCFPSQFARIKQAQYVRAHCPPSFNSSD